MKHSGKENFQSREERIIWKMEVIWRQDGSFHVKSK
jgi:hypothetical protein